MLSPMVIAKMRGTIKLTLYLYLHVTRDRSQKRPDYYIKPAPLAVS